MLDHDEGHATVVWHRREEFLQRIQPTGRSADTDYDEI
jgi:hypothetical protein